MSKFGLLFTSFLACKGPVSPAPAPTPGSTASSSTPTPAPAAHRVEPNCTGMSGPLRHSGMVFWGWSPDGRHYAIEVAPCGQGATDCDEQVSFAIVDAETDTFVIHQEIRQQEIQQNAPADRDETVPCTPPDMAAAVLQARTTAMDAHPIQIGSGTTPIPLTHTEDGLWRAVLPSGAPLTLRLTVGPEGEDRGWQGGSWYRLEASRGGPWVTIESGRRTREWVNGYHMGPAVYLSPDGEHVAVLIIEERVAYEGTEWNHRSNGFNLRRLSTNTTSSP